MMRKLVGSTVKLAISEGVLSAEHSDVIGGSPGLSREQLVQAQFAPREDRGGFVPLDQELLAIGLGEYRQSGDGLLWIAGDRLQKDREILAQTPDSGGLEQVGVVLHSQKRPAGAKRSIDEQLEGFVAPWV